MLRTRKPRIPSYCHHRPSGQAYVRIEGRTFYLGRYGSRQSRAEYNRLLSEWLAHGRHMPDVHDLTLTELIARFWKHVQTAHPAPRQSQFRSALGHIRRLYGDTLANAFGPAALRTVRQAFIEAEWSRTYVNQQVDRVRQMFRWAVGHELVHPSVLHRLQVVEGLRRGQSSARDSEPVGPVPSERVDAIQAHLSRQVWGMVELQRLTGMRPGEVILMRACDIDTTGDVWLYRPAQHKNRWRGTERTIELGPRALEVVKAFLKPDVEACLFSPADAEAERRARNHVNRRTPLKQGNRPGTNRTTDPKKQPGDRYDVGSYRRAIHRACARACPPPDDLSESERQQWRRDHQWNPHQLRHSYATRIRKEYGLEIVKVMLGQTTLSAAQVYAEIDRTKAREIAAKIG